MNKWEIIVEVREAFLPRLGLDLTESTWRRDSESGLMYRIDPPRPEMKLHRHIHIADPKHVSASHKQVSWNGSGTKHDPGSFNDRFARMNAARDLATRVLKLPKHTVLETIEQDPLQAFVDQLLESEYTGPEEFLFRVV